MAESRFRKEHLDSDGEESNELNRTLSGQIAEKSEQAFTPLVEDLADWLSRVLKIEIKAENFMDYLDNGCLVCQLAQVVQRAAEESAKAGKWRAPLPQFKMKYHKTAKAGSFFARDNAAFFLKWCKEIGVQDSVMFESEGLVLQKEPREVVLCLLEVARIASNFGIEPPGLVKLEREIDAEIAAEEEKREAKESKSTKKSKRNSRVLNLDVEVSRIAAKYNIIIERIKEGRYVVDGKINIFVRILRKHIMVRVGGGWDTLENFISRHDPNKIGRILTSDPTGRSHQLTSDVLHKVQVPAH